LASPLQPIISSLRSLPLRSPPLQSNSHTHPHPHPHPHRPWITLVMNTQEEINQAFADYRSGHLQRADDDVWAADEL